MHPIYAEIRKQLRLTQSTRDAAVVERWIPEQWWEAFVFTFYYGPKHASQPDVDDLLFLVLNSELRAANDTPYTVIRRMEELPAEFHKNGTQFEKIDWRSTLELNLVMQTAYTLTVAICTAEEVPALQQATPFLYETSIRVAKRVHASTVTVGLDCDHKKAEQTEVCYPEICFAVEDFEEAFSSMVLTEESQRFCVMLTTGEVLTPTEIRVSSPVPPPDATQSEEDVQHDPLMNPSATERGTEEAQESSGNRIFGGVVTFDQVKRGLLGRGQCLPRRILQERVVMMKGPGGQGMAEVFTSIDASTSQPTPPAETTSEDGDLGWLVQRTSFLQRGVQSARDLFLRLGSEKGKMVLDVTDESVLKFRCSLMTLTLPVSLVAHKILEL